MEKIRRALMRDNSEYDCGRGYIRVGNSIFSIYHCRSYRAGFNVNTTYICDYRSHITRLIPLRKSIYLRSRIHIPLTLFARGYFTYKYKYLHTLLVYSALNMVYHRFIVFSMMG